MSGIKTTTKSTDKYGASLIMNQDIEVGTRAPRTSYLVECYDKDGNLKWVDSAENTVTTVGKNDLIDQYFGGTAPSVFVGLKDTGSVVAGDTMASHAGWATITPYSNATDPALTLAAASGGTADNSASKAVFNINATDDVYGAFVKTDSTKGGTAGVLYGGGDFAAPRSVANGDTLNVTVTITMT